MSVAIPNNITLQLNLDDLLIWVLVGLVAGFIASRVMLGHGVGLLADIVIGILGAIVGNLIADVAGFRVAVAGHPIISQIVMALFGAVILLLVFRLLGLSGRRRRVAL